METRIDRLIRIDTSLFPFHPDIDACFKAKQTLEQKSGPGSEFLGWLRLPLSVTDTSIAEVESAAAMLRQSDSLVVVGIGGSYLGTRAVLEALQWAVANPFPVHFAGHHLDAAYHAALLADLRTKRYSINVISKSGTTTEPGIAFRLLWSDLKARFPVDELRKLVVATTDEHKGSLRRLAQEWTLRSFIVPDDVGGRYSVFTPVGLLPLATAGINIRKLLAGAKSMAEYLLSTDDFEANPALVYAACRQAAYGQGKKIEILATYEPRLQYLAEWWKQLFGESEGKGHKGIFPASVSLTSDLHSMGQWMQDGERIIQETVLDVKNGASLPVPHSERDDDGLNFLAGKEMHDINRAALQGSLQAHSSGGVPCLRIELDELGDFSLGALMYFFEYACGVSAYMQGVNPFDQPGVEAYKKNMFRLLGKPGF